MKLLLDFLIFISELVMLVCTIAFVVYKNVLAKRKRV